VRPLAAAARARVGTWSPPGLRPVLALVSAMLMALSVLMLLPALAEVLTAGSDGGAFALCAALTAAAAAGLRRVTAGALDAGLSLRQAFLLTPLAWASVALFAALPMVFVRHEGLTGEPAHAVFEAVSGLTTTGATVLSGLDDAASGLLLWRALLQWVGGIGIIATAIAILPALSVGGMQMFRTESSDRSEKVLPRAKQISTAIGGVYLGLTVLWVIGYRAAGMGWFDALCHGLSTISTAGFSTRDASLAAFDAPLVHWWAVLGMLMGAMPFVLYVRLINRDWTAFHDSQARTLLWFLLAVVIVVAASLWLTGRYDLEPALRHAAVNVVSVVTTTGFASSDYTLWGNAATGLFFGLMFVGGCTGSTSGGMKIFRFEVMAAMLRVHMLRLIYPRGMFPRTYAGRPLNDDVVNSVVVFFCLYFMCYGALTIALMGFGLDFLTSASGAVSALSNVGPGLGQQIGPVGNYGGLPDGALWLLSFAMLLGRLDLFTVLVLFLPRFWRG
jgi:trk system potassium uptake protein TrkH